MRAREFLLEYNQQATMQRFGDKLLQNAARDGSPEISTVFNLLNSGKEIDEHTKGNALISIMQALEAADPTKNKEYTVFLAKMYAGGGWGAHIEDLDSKIKPALAKFHKLKLKKKLPSPRNDIMRYSDLADFVAVLDEYPDPDADKKGLEKGDAYTAFENDKVRIVVPNDQAAACYYGQGTRWCTAATQGSNYFSHYSKDGPLYILLPKQPKHDGEKYQLHFATEQFMDENDYSVEDIIYLLEHRFGNLIPFFKEEMPEGYLNDWLMFADDDVLEPLVGKIHRAVMDHVYERVSEWEMEDDYWYEHLRKEGYVYPEGHEEEGQIDWDKVAEADIHYTDWNYEVADWIGKVESAVNLRPVEIRRIAEEGYKAGEGIFGLKDLDTCIAYNVEQEFLRSRDGDGGIQEWITKHIQTSRSSKGKWDVRLVYRQKDGGFAEYEIH